MGEKRGNGCVFPMVTTMIFGLTLMTPNCLFKRMMVGQMLVLMGVRPGQPNSTNLPRNCTRSKLMISIPIGYMRVSKTIIPRLQYQVSLHMPFRIRVGVGLSIQGVVRQARQFQNPVITTPFMPIAKVDLECSISLQVSKKAIM